MSEPLKSHDLLQWTHSFSGVQLSPTKCEVTQTGATWTGKVGANGQAVRSRTNDDSATIKLTFMAEQQDNDILSAIHNADKLAPNGVGVGVLLVKNQQGRAVYECHEASIFKAPDPSIEGESTERVWEFWCPNLNRFDGGQG